MGKILVITEKPSVGKDCADYLECKEKHKGYIEGDKYIVSWALGHLISLKDPEEYNPDWKIWDINKLPIIPENFDLKILKDTKEQFEIVKKLINRKDVTSLVNAGDSAREGELIQRYIYNMAGNTKPIKRLWISSTTRAAIAEGFANLRDSSEFDSLYESALARSHIDWLYGMNYTRAFTKKFGNGKVVLSTGRCQTPLLKLVVDRDKEIDTFVPTPYYEIQGDFKDYQGKYINAKGTSKIETKEEAERIISLIKNKEGLVTDVTEEKKSVVAPQLYNLNSLSQKMNSKYGFSAQKTLDVLQRLYEIHKIATYPRASAKVMSNSIFDEFKTNINYINFGEFSKYVPELNITKSKRFVDDTKIEDHHAIIPDFKNPNISSIYKKLNTDEKKVFDELIKSVLAAFMPNYEYNSTTINTNVNGYNFITKGKQVVKLGWKTLYNDEKDFDEVDNITTKVNKGDRKKLIKSTILSKMTKPKSRYTEAELLKAMAKYGIGTSATMSSLIETLKKRKYVSEKGKALISTPLGKEFISIIPIEDIKSVELTSDLENDLEQIVEGKVKRKDLEQKVIKVIKNNINKIKDLKTSMENINTEISIGKCPKCGKPIFKNSKGYGCSGYKDGCNFFIGEICGKKLTESQIKTLLAKGETNIIKGFKSKKGTSFDAKLKLENGSIKFDFSTDNNTSSNTKSNLICPHCNKPMYLSDKVCKCDNCNIVIFREIAHKKLSETNIKQLLLKGETGIIKGFKSKKGTSFDAKLKLDSANKISFIFENKKK